MNVLLISVCVSCVVLVFGWLMLYDVSVMCDCVAAGACFNVCV